MVKIGLVLSGGGAKAFAEIGALKVMEKKGIKPDYVVGCSAGGLIGTLLCAGLNAAQIEEYVLDKPLSHFKPSWRRAGILEGDHFVKAVLKNANVSRFEQLKIPLIVNATDLNTGEEVVFSEGLLSPALNSTIAFPGIFLPRKFMGSILIDGGVFNPLPIHLLPKVDKMIVADVSMMDVDISERAGSFKVFQKATLHLQRRVVLKTIEQYSILENFYLIQPELKKYNFFEVRRRVLKEIIALGEREAKKVLKDF